MSRIISLLFAVLFTFSATPAQIIPIATREALELGSKNDPGETALRAARDALAKGQGEEALRHLRFALEVHPFAAPVLRELLVMSAGDRDVQSLWAHDAVSVLVEGRGRGALDATLKKLLPKGNPDPERLAEARALAIAELADWASKLRHQGAQTIGNGLLVAWAIDAASELALASPRAALRHSGTFNAARARHAPRRDVVITALEGVLTKALSRGDPGEIVIVARRLLAFASQASFKDLKGPPAPDLAALRARAADALASARARLEAGRNPPATIETLEALSPEAAAAFTAAHGSWSNPGMGVSPNERYRVETTCGYETLLEVLRTIELHHQRLVGWFGGDPFKKEPGIVRIVPEHSELEAEGTPYWWNGGFQSGRVTTVVFQTGNIEGLGRLLTHELTHRFDGAFHAGIPSWLSEGRAVRTGAAYREASDREFVDLHVLFKTVESAYMSGYEELSKLEQLIAGTIEDYRDNYVAGYALHIYLDLWSGNASEPIFRSRLNDYMKGAFRARSKPLEWFSRSFADGKEGRPDGMEEFAKGFAEFLAGFYWQTPAPWTSQFVSKLKTPKVPYIYDAPTWTWERERAEPRFGQNQAVAAMDLLLSHGDREGAAVAGVWGLSVDEWSDTRAEAVALSLERVNEAQAAWAVRALRAARRGEGAPTPAPMLRSLPRVGNLLDTMTQAAERARTDGRVLTAAALAADAQRLAELLGATLSLSAKPVEVRRNLHPFDAPRMRLASFGLVEDELTDYEERRVPNLWYQEALGDLHVGREKPRSGTGELDREAHQRDAFVRSGLWLRPGCYSLRARIRFTTSYVSGAVTVGYMRRDRQIRLAFRAGDYHYSIGNKENANVLDEVDASIRGLFVREPHLEGSTPARTVRFPTPQSSFGLEILVDGPIVQARIDGELIGTYQTPDGSPVEGFIGFAARYGAYCVEAATVQRLDRSNAYRLAETSSLGLDFDENTTAPLDIYLNQPVRGIPRTPQGTILIVVPEDLIDPERLEGSTADPPLTYDSCVRPLRRVGTLLAENGANQPVLIALPVSVKASYAAALETEVTDVLGRPCASMRHQRKSLPPADGDGPVRFERAWILFVDPSGTIRSASPFYAGPDRIDSTLEHWISVFKVRGP